jgi:hypothetical protein
MGQRNEIMRSLWYLTLGLINWTLIYWNIIPLNKALSHQFRHSIRIMNCVLAEILMLYNW